MRLQAGSVVCGLAQPSLLASFPGVGTAGQGLQVVFCPNDQKTAVTKVKPVSLCQAFKTCTITLTEYNISPLAPVLAMSFCCNFI